MDRFVVRGDAARQQQAEQQRRRRRRRDAADGLGGRSGGGRQIRIDDLREVVRLPSSGLHPAPAEIERLARVLRDPRAGERDACAALRALACYDIAAEDLRGGRVAAAVRWRRDRYGAGAGAGGGGGGGGTGTAGGGGRGAGGGGGAGAPAPGVPTVTPSHELARRLLDKWRARVLDDARRQRRRRPLAAAFGGGGGGGGGSGAAAARRGTGLGDDKNSGSDGEGERGGS